MKLTKPIAEAKMDLINSIHAMSDEEFEDFIEFLAEEFEHEEE